MSVRYLISNKLQAQEKALEIREENIDRKVELLGKKEREQQNFKRLLEERHKGIETKQVELDRMVAEENERLERVSGISRDEAKRLLVEEGYDPIYGARPLKRTIQRKLLDPLALKVLEGAFGDGDTIRVEAAGDDLAFTKQTA